MKIGRKRTEKKCARIQSFGFLKRLPNTKQRGCQPQWGGGNLSLIRFCDGDESFSEESAPDCKTSDHQTIGRVKACGLASCSLTMGDAVVFGTFVSSFHSFPVNCDLAPTSPKYSLPFTRDFSVLGCLPIGGRPD